MIIPHCGIKSTINRNFPTDLHERNVRIALEPIQWQNDSDGKQPKRAFVNNFSAAGGNTALLIEEAPTRPASTGSQYKAQHRHLVAVSAKSPLSLQGNLKTLRHFLQKHPLTSLANLAYTTTARRTHHQHRVLLACETIGDLEVKLEKAIQEGSGATRPKKSPHVVFTFTGQGGMEEQERMSYSQAQRLTRRL